MTLLALNFEMPELGFVGVVLLLGFVVFAFSALGRAANGGRGPGRRSSWNHGNTGNDFGSDGGGSGGSWFGGFDGGDGGGCDAGGCDGGD